MATVHRPAFLHALSSLHCGTGQGVGSIDLPVLRERATHLPLVPGSTIKGCLRDACKASLTPDKWTAIFGPERGEGANEFAGALRVSDARLLLLPVRALAGTFAWVTSPFLLHRFTREMVRAGETLSLPVPTLADGQARVATAVPLATFGGKKKLVLEEFDFETTAQGADQWATWLGERLFSSAMLPWRAELAKRLAIIDDQSFDHLAEFATEVNAHIAIDQKTGTVDSGALWYQESLPAETVLSLVLQADDARKGSPLKAPDVLASIKETSSVQFGGKATTGMGIARLVPFGGAQ